jgi:uncharacterized protein YndB with AHSA1/START domain
LGRHNNAFQVDPKSYLETGKGMPWRFIHKDRDGNAYAFHGVHHEIAPFERIIRTFEFEGLPEKGHASRLDIEPQGTVVCLTVTHEDLEADSEFHKGMMAGWPKVLSDLKTLLETGRILNIDWGDLKRLGHWDD